MMILSVGIVWPQKIGHDAYGQDHPRNRAIVHDQFETPSTINLKRGLDDSAIPSTISLKYIYDGLKYAALP